jgi:branched-chain amino acid transport system substrate-binding protein
MKSKTAIGIIVIIIILAIIGISVFSLGITGKASSKESITIGFMGPLTGDTGAYGQNEKNAIEMALEKINNEGGINGNALKVIYEDGKCLGKDAAIAVQKLVEIDKVKVILGGACSGETLAAAPITEKSKVILFSAFSSNPAISNSGDYVFRVSPPDDDAGIKIASEMIKKYNKVAILSENTDYALGVRKVFIEEYKKMGGSVIADEIYNQGEKDYRTQIAKIKESNPDVIFVNPQDGVTMGYAFKQIRELGLNQQIFTVMALQDALEIAGNAMDNAIIADWPDVPKNGINLIEKYKERYGKMPVHNWAVGARYDSVFIIANALKKCGENTDCIKDFLYNMDWYDGVIGRYKFDSNGDPIGIEYVLKTVKNGNFVSFEQDLSGTIKIGATLSLTGDMSAYGLGAQNALLMAQDLINGNGGINGKELKIIFEDDTCDPKVAINTINKLIFFDNVKAVIGPVCSTAMLPVAPIAEQNKVILFSGSATNSKITQAGDFIFRNIPSDSFQGKYAAEFIFSNMNKKNVAVGFSNEEYGAGLKDVFVSRFKELGGTIVDIESNERGAADMRAQLEKIKQSKPELIYYNGFPKDIGNFVKQARELGINVTIFTGEIGGDAQITTIAGNAANGLLYTQPRQMTSDEFKADYKSRFGTDPALYSDNYYDIAYLLANAMKICAEDSNCIKNELYKIKDYKGVSGTITIDGNGDLATAEYDINIISDGKSTLFR